MAKRGRPRHPDVLTPREWEVLALLREGRSNEEIAERLGISLAGAKYHVSEILSKLGVSSREEAASWRPSQRPWWAIVATPLGALRRAASASRLSALVAGAAVVVVAGGIGLLVWGLVRTGGGDEPSAATGALSPPAAVVASPTPCPTGGPAEEGADTFAYFAPDGTIWLSTGDGRGQQLICGAASPLSAARSSTGRYLAYASAEGKLWLHDAQTGGTTLIDDGTAGAVLSSGTIPPSSVLRWSPAEDLLVYEKFGEDGRSSIGLWEVRPGSASVAFVQTEGSPAFDWSPDGRLIVYAVSGGVPTVPPNVRTGQLFVVNADGSDAHKLTDGIFILSDPWSPDGRLLAYWKDDHGGSSMIGDIYIMDVESGREFSLGEFTSDEGAQWSRDRSRNVFHNLAIDAETQSAVPLFERPSVILDWSPDGQKVAYVEGAAFGPPPRSLVVLDVESGETTTLHTSDAFTAHALGSGYGGEWSPDSRYYAFVVVDSAPAGTDLASLHVADTQSGQVRLLLDGFHFGDVYGAYSRDSTRLLIQRDERPSPSIWIANADGTGVSKVADGLALGRGSDSPAWRPAGR